MKDKNVMGKMASGAGKGGKAMSSDAAKLRQTVSDNKAKNNQTNKSGGTNGTSTAGNKDNNQSQQNNGKEKSKGQQTAQEAGTEAAKQALKTAAGAIPWTRWIPKNIRDRIIDKFMDSEAGQAAVEKEFKKIKQKVIMIAVSAIASVFGSLIMLGALYAMIAAPIGWISDVLGIVGDFFSSVWNAIQGKGWCATDSECQSDAYNDYYDTLEEAIKNYSGKCEINEDLITATIFYGQMVSEEKIESDTNNEDTNEYDSEADEAAGFYYNYLDVSEASFRQTAESQINKLLNVYLKGEGMDKEDLNSTEDNPVIIDDDNPCSISSARYKQYLIDTYIDWAYPSVITEERTKEVIAEEILKMGNILLINKAYSTSVYCDSISVEQENGEIETMDLETYVARCITEENDMYEGDNIENMKAQAIASRTYALNSTNNCKNPIKNSQTAQTVADTAIPQAIKAAEETEGLVLLEDGKIFSAQYDALAIDYDLTNEKNDENYYLKQQSFAIPKTWLDARVNQSQYDFYKKYNHGNGMSQWGSFYLQTIGSNYEQILGTFYTMAEISKMGGLISGGNYSSNSEPAASVNDLKDRSNTVVTTSNRQFNLYSSDTGLISQCSWFGRTRAIEIIYYSNMPEDIKDTAINSLMATNANGGQWYDNADGTIFTKNADYTQPKPGSMAVWTSSCHQYGHVAIVEQVYEEDGETKILLSETWNQAGIHAANTFENTFYQIKPRTLDYMNSHTNSEGCVSSFVGYVYLLG